MSDQETARKYADILQDAILEIDPTINLSWKRMFGGAGYYANGEFFAAWFRGDSLALKLPEQAHADLLQIEGAREVSRHYVEVPQSFLGNVAVMAAWVSKSIEYARSLSGDRSEFGDL
jgi:TfoX/Sxy family transcriptional regulator of competence genes